MVTADDYDDYNSAWKVVVVVGLFEATWIAHPRLRVREGTLRD
jgi:hypothetical protein